MNSYDVWQFQATYFDFAGVLEYSTAAGWFPDLTSTDRQETYAQALKESDHVVSRVDTPTIGLLSILADSLTMAYPTTSALVN